MTEQSAKRPNRIARLFWMEVVAVALLAFAAASALGQGNEDPSFGNAGAVLLPSNPYFTRSGALDLAEDSQGRLISVGESQFGFGALRLTKAGSPDPTFGTNGFAQTLFGFDAAATAVAIQPDGKILAAGRSLDRPGVGMALARYDATGLRDTTFASDGRLVVSLHRSGGAANSVLLEPSGKIIVAGLIRDVRRPVGAVVRLKPSGELDRSFGQHGIVRFDPGKSGRSEIDSMTRDASGRITVAGLFNGKTMLGRFHGDGRRDRSFGGGDGMVIQELDRRRHCSCAYTVSLAEGAGGRAVIASAENRNIPFSVLATYRKSGRLDRSFGRRGLVRIRHGLYTSIEDVAMQQNGKIAAVGDSGPARPRFTVLRFRKDGKPDRSFDGDGVFVRAIGGDSAARTALVQRDGRLLAGGWGTPPDGSTGFAFLRFLP